MLIFSVVLLRDNARPHKVTCNGALSEHFSWEMFAHHPYGPVLALNDYHLFTYLKNCVGSQHFLQP
jgi:hypothetical protein